MFEIIAMIAVVLAIAIILILAAAKPDRFSVQRAITVKAPPERIFPTTFISGAPGRLTKTRIRR